MRKTAVGLFANRSVVDTVVYEIESLGFPRHEIRTVGEPLDLGATGVMSIPRIDFEVDLSRELTKMGATKRAIQAYVEGLRRGGVLVFATGTVEKVDRAAEIMNERGAIETAEDRAREAQLHSVVPESDLPKVDGVVQAGRLRPVSGGACFFVW